MKKIFFLATVLVVVFSFWGANFSKSLFQTVPVTLGSIKPAQSFKITELGLSPVSIEPLVPSIVSTPTAFKMFMPVAVNEQPVPAAPIATVVPVEAPVDQALNDFIRTVSGTGTDQVTGVYVRDQFSLPVLQQPAGNASYVSTQNGTVTQFDAANAYGTVGLLAHNYLSGKQFFNLQIGNDVVVVTGNGGQVLYRITKIERYQALSPTSTYSDFIDLADPAHTVLSAGQVFQRIYTVENQVVLQTCIEANGNSSWGRLFVLAEKITQ